MKKACSGITIAIIASALALPATAAPKAERVYLSGTGPDDAVEWDFFCSKGRKSDSWEKIPVPSCWEQHGFGNYNYGHDIPKHDETGTYRTTFEIPKDWKDKHIRLVFEGIMTQAEVKINGKPLGTPLLGGYIVHRLNLEDPSLKPGHPNKLLKFGELNELEVLVKKKPDNYTLDHGERKADYWVFGGIYRPVYLEVQPRVFVNRVAVDAKANGNFSIDVFPQVHYLTKFRQKKDLIHCDEIQAQIQTLDGKNVGEVMSYKIAGGTGRARLSTKITDPKLWSPEYPNLYQVKVTLLKQGVALSEKTERFGFRTFEVKQKDGFYLNGERIIIQGVNRNVFDAQHGRTVSRDRVWKDARAIKAMNANLVRSHLPATKEFMRACDELGIMIIAELTTWHRPIIDTSIARNIGYEIVTYYQNHPSVIIWANGNEGGFNLDIDELFHLFDPQDRPVVHPWSLFEGIDTAHYPRWDILTQKLSAEDIYLPTEFAHGLYDGGHGAGLEDYWNAILKSSNGAGGVLWCWADAAIARTDMDGKLDTYGNKSADGIVGPNGEKEGSYYTVRELWSPIQIPVDRLPADFTGTLPIENRYDFTSLSDCSFEWRLLQFSDPMSKKTKAKVLSKGNLKGPKVAPGKSGILALPLPSDWKSSDALELTATAPNGTEVMKWSWAAGTSKPIAADSSTLPKQNKDKPFDIQIADTLWSFSPETGQLKSCSVKGEDTGLGLGPVRYAATEDGKLDFPGEWKAKASTEGNNIVIQSNNKKDGSSFIWKIQPGGLVELAYSFAPITKALTHCAVGFDLPDEAVKSKRWLGGGPFRVWGNRLVGPQYGLWENDYNDSVTGHTWEYPEFKGVFENVDWMRLDLSSGSVLLLDTEAGSQVGVLQPTNKDIPPGKTDNDFGPKKAIWDYPKQGGLFLFHKVPAVGSKFMAANRTGPQSKPHKVEGKITGKVVFQVR
ncbi:hypothetical protein BVX97_03710 [bacterium E08(2017)]|nr:hypothetical protein BVX97_03710 [bacterium E08(2017)]